MPLASPLASTGIAGAQAQTNGDDLPALNKQAGQLFGQAKYTEATPIAERALALAERQYGPDHRIVALSANNLGALYQAQGRYADAEPYLKRSLAIREKALGPDHIEVAQSLNNLATLYNAGGVMAMPSLS